PAGDVIGLLLVSFFFTAEDGIRDFHVTGVQTCALPIYRARHGRVRACPAPARVRPARHGPAPAAWPAPAHAPAPVARRSAHAHRSEERRVGKDSRSAWTSDQCKRARTC